MSISRDDYALPFSINPVSRQVSLTGYATHVDQMIRQVLLTAPGERIDLPQFGCGLRQIVFAPLSSALEATTQIEVRQALDRWLAGIIEVTDVTVTSSDDSGGPPGPGKLLVSITYMIIDTLTAQQTQVLLP